MELDKRISLRLPSGLHKRLVAKAEIDRRSLNSEIVHLLEVTLDRPVADDDSP